MPLRLGEEIQEVLRRDDGDLSALLISLTRSSPPRSAIIEAEEVAVMKSRQGYKGYVIVARSCELREGEFSAEFSVEEHDESGLTETPYNVQGTFPTEEIAIVAATQAGRQKIDVGFERGRAVANG